MESLLNYLIGQTRPYLFGGVLRDLALQGVDGLESDIDLVYEGRIDVDGLRHLGISMENNRFDGFRTKTDLWLVDLWNVEETWAFRNHVVEYQGIESLLSTTITNWESVLYDIAHERLMLREGYLKDINDRYLDMVLEENPNPVGVSVRLLRAYVHKNARYLSPSAASAIRSAVRTYSFKELRGYEECHYISCYITRPAYDHILDHEVLARQDLLPVALDRVNPSLPLI